LNQLNKQQQEEKAWLFAESHQLSIVSPCTIGDGIACLSEEQIISYLRIYEASNKLLCFFVPSSGMGSRMFEELMKALNKNELQHSSLQKWIANIHKFPFDPGFVKSAQTDPLMLLKRLLYNDDQGIINQSKGSIPFHSYENGSVLTPFQEHLVQSSAISSLPVHVHFTVQEDKKEVISEKLSSFIEDSALTCRFSLSVQNKATDAFVFSSDGRPFLKEGTWMRRPAGHGALLENLNALQEEIILVRNIDNIPHQDHSEMVNYWWKVLVGCLLHVKKEVEFALQKPDKEVLTNLISNFNLYSSEELSHCKNEEDLTALLKRPLRVCGMVKNQGQPGGGPFWVKHAKGVSKQIVEGAQLVGLENEKQLLSESSHFNPVMIAVHRTDWNDKPFDLMGFMDVGGGMKIKRQYDGNEIVFRERPGLWNEAMANWNSVFIEIPEHVFTPVKTVFDLLNPVHQRNQ